MSFAVFRLDCPSCGKVYANILPAPEDSRILLCTACGGRLDRGPRLTGKEITACGFYPAGGG